MFRNDHRWFLVDAKCSMKIIYNMFSAPLTSQILSTPNSMIVGLIEDFEC